MLDFFRRKKIRIESSIVTVRSSVTSVKVQLFWEGHKNLRNLPHGLEIYLVNVQTMRKIAQIFMAFSEKLNFKNLKLARLNGE